MNRNGSRSALLKRKTVLCITGLFLSSRTVVAQVVLEPSDYPVTLQGTIRMAFGYDPPGYGEDKAHDGHIHYLALQLDRPVNIPCTPEKEEYRATECQATKRMRLIFDNDPDGKLEAATKSLIGRRVNLLGVLERQDTAER